MLHLWANWPHRCAPGHWLVGRATGKVTVGLAVHLAHEAQGLRKGDEHRAYASVWSIAFFTFCIISKQLTLWTQSLVMVPAAFSHSIVIRILHYTRLMASFPRQPVSQYQYGKTSLDLDQAGDDGVWGCCGISWTICKQSAPRSRQITTLTPHYSIITGQMLLQCLQCFNAVGWAAGRASGL